MFASFYMQIKQGIWSRIGRIVEWSLRWWVELDEQNITIVMFKNLRIKKYKHILSKIKMCFLFLERIEENEKKDIKK